MQPSIDLRVLLSAVAIAALAALFAAPAVAQPFMNYPWCAATGGGSGSMNGYDGGESCAFTSYEQCMETARPSGFCRANPFYKPDEPATHTQRTRHISPGR
jgi:hypothetical protein